MKNKDKKDRSETMNFFELLDTVKTPEIMTPLSFKIECDLELYLRILTLEELNTKEKVKNLEVTQANLDLMEKNVYYFQLKLLLKILDRSEKPLKKFETFFIKELKEMFDEESTKQLIKDIDNFKNILIDYLAYLKECRAKKRNDFFEEREPQTIIVNSKKVKVITESETKQLANQRIKLLESWIKQFEIDNTARTKSNEFLKGVRANPTKQYKKKTNFKTMFLKINRIREIDGLLTEHPYEELEQELQEERNELIESLKKLPKNYGVDLENLGQLINLYKGEKYALFITTGRYLKPFDIKIHEYLLERFTLLNSHIKRNNKNAKIETTIEIDLEHFHEWGGFKYKDFKDFKKDVKASLLTLKTLNYAQFYEKDDKKNYTIGALINSYTSLKSGKITIELNKLYGELLQYETEEITIPRAINKLDISPNHKHREINGAIFRELADHYSRNRRNHKGGYAIRTLKDLLSSVGLLQQEGRHLRRKLLPFFEVLQIDQEKKGKILSDYYFINNLTKNTILKDEINSLELSNDIIENYSIVYKMADMEELNKDLSKKHTKKKGT